MKNVQVIEQQKPKSLWARSKEALFVGAVGASTMVVSTVHAADNVDYAQATNQVSGVQTAIVAVIGVLVTVLGIVLAWRTFRSSAK